MTPVLLTVGHGTAAQGDFTSLLAGAGVSRVVDVRRYPGSRKHPHMAREKLEQWLPDAGISYSWEPKLGGRRRLEPDSPDVWWRVEAFRAYAGHMRSPDFAAALNEVLHMAATSRTAIMCSESLWWRCHRRMIADFVVLARGGDVQHLTHDGRLASHEAAEGARVSGGLLVYDARGDPIRSRSQTSSD